MVNIEKVLPVYYKKSQYMLSLCQTNDKEFDRLYTKMDKFENNLSIDDADESGVKAFEGDFNIKTTSDIFEIRKKRVKAKFLGTLPTTEKNLLNSIQVFDENAYIVKHISDYSFEVHIQKPEMLMEIIALVEDIKPAHLGVRYFVTTPEPEKVSINVGGYISDREYGYSIPSRQTRTYADLQQMTYEEMQSKTYSQLLYEE